MIIVLEKHYSLNEDLRVGLSTVEFFKTLKSNGTDDLVKLEGETLNRFQAVLLDITEDIKSVCNENNITYMLLGGSLLGAVRHNGFIPWDDDMDLGILSSDYDRFIKCFKERFGSKYWVHTDDTPEYGMTIGRIRLKGSICRGREDAYLDECGFFVDLFRIENVSDNKLLRKLHEIICMAMGLFLSCRVFYRNRDLMRELAEGNKTAEKVFNRKILIGSLLRFASVTKWAQWTQKCHEMCKNNNSKCVAIPSGRKHFSGEIYERQGLCNTVLHCFDGHEFAIPKDYDGYLTQLYGDYMSIPPVQKRESHILLELKFPGDS